MNWNYKSQDNQKIAQECLLFWFFLPSNSYIFISLPFSSSSSLLMTMNYYRKIRLLTYLRLRIGYNDKLPETQNLIWINCNFPHLAMAWAREFNVIYFHPTENMSLMLTVPCLVCISSWLPYNYYFILPRERDRKSKMINEMLANLCLHYQWPKATHWIFQHSLARNAFYFFVIITILVLAF